MNILLIINNKKDYINVINKYKTEIVNNYNQAINMINNNKYDCIIIDSLCDINIRKLLNNYKNKSLINMTIIINDYYLSSYNLLDRRYQVYSIIKRSNIKEDLPYYIDELLECKKVYNVERAHIYKEISLILKRMGISPEKDGFHYLRKAIYECYINPSLLNNINNYLYPILSKTFNISINSIIRSMNYAIETGFNKSDYEYEEKIFSNTIDIDKGKPTNIGFITTIVDELLLENNITYY